MKPQATVALVLALSGNALAQTATATPPALDALLSEVRLLRLAIERQTAVVARSQVLVARLSTQEQRLIRARALQESLESRMADFKAEEDQTRGAIERVEAALDNPARAAQRKDIEGELRSMQDRLKTLEKSASDLQARRAVADQNAENERVRLEELESQLLREDFSGREKR